MFQLHVCSMLISNLHVNGDDKKLMGMVNITVIHTYMEGVNICLTSLVPSTLCSTCNVTKNLQNVFIFIIAINRIGVICYYLYIRYLYIYVFVIFYWLIVFTECVDSYNCN